MFKTTESCKGTCLRCHWLQRKYFKISKEQALFLDYSLAASKLPSGCQEENCLCRFTNSSFLMGCFGICAMYPAGGLWTYRSFSMSQMVQIHKKYADLVCRSVWTHWFLLVVSFRTRFTSAQLVWLPPSPEAGFELVMLVLQSIPKAYLTLEKWRLGRNRPYSHPK